MDIEPIHITVPGSPDDPRSSGEYPDGLIIHHTPSLHPDDVEVVGGLPCTSVARTLIDLAEAIEADELRGCFARAVEMGLLDPVKLQASRGRVEWRPSLAMFDEVAAEFAPGDGL